jgi:hypothetical protein
MFLSFHLFHYSLKCLKSLNYQMSLSFLNYHLFQSFLTYLKNLKNLNYQKYLKSLILLRMGIHQTSNHHRLKD